MMDSEWACREGTRAACPPAWRRGTCGWHAARLGLPSMLLLAGHAAEPGARPSALRRVHPNSQGCTPLPPLQFARPHLPWSSPPRRLTAAWPAARRCPHPPLSAAQPAARPAARPAATAWCKVWGARRGALSRVCKASPCSLLRLAAPQPLTHLHGAMLRGALAHQRRLPAARARRRSGNRHLNSHCHFALVEQLLNLSHPEAGRRLCRCGCQRRRQRSKVGALLAAAGDCGRGCLAAWSLLLLAVLSRACRRTRLLLRPGRRLLLLAVHAGACLNARLLVGLTGRCSSTRLLLAEGCVRALLPAGLTGRCSSARLPARLAGRCRRRLLLA